MNKPTQWLNAARQLCDEIGPEDGIDPRYLPRHTETKSRNHKTRQLCREARRILSLILPGEVSDPLLQNLEMVDVTTNDECEFLWVTLIHTDGGVATDNNEIERRLHAMQGFLRSAIARAVRRKRVPALKFKVASTTDEVMNHAYSKNNH